MDLRNVKPEGSDYSFSELAQDMDLAEPGFEFPDPIEVELILSKSGDEVIVQGRIKTAVEVECSRCLDIYEIDINPKLQFVIQMLDTISPQQSNDDDFIILPKTTGEYDIVNRIREAIILELPLKPLCSDNCKGLCPMCGINLNEEQCDCAPDKTDERWDSLKQLFNE